MATAPSPQPAKTREELEQQILARVNGEMQKRAKDALKSQEMHARLGGHADETKKVLQECKDAVLAAAKDMVKRGGRDHPNDEQQVVAPLRASAERMVRLELDGATIASAAMRTASAITAGEGALDGDIPAQFKAQFDAIVSARPADVVKRHALYQSVARVFDKGASDDVEVEGEDEDDAVLKWQCPLTKEPVDNPVKNRQCGHTINAASLDMLLKKQHGGDATCPFRGCSAPVKKSLYEPDDDLRMKHEGALRRQSSAAKRAKRGGDATKRGAASKRGGAPDDDPVE